MPDASRTFIKYKSFLKNEISITSFQYKENLLKYIFYGYLHMLLHIIKCTRKKDKIFYTFLTQKYRGSNK